MEVNADFSRRAALHTGRIAWVDSPMPGVQRKMLDRIGGEVARATSIVRYAPNSQFSPHAHGGGEEFLVLAGVFQDERGDYPVGTYVRNPPRSEHRPSSRSGCVIFVKLWQFDPSDDTHHCIDTNSVVFAAAPARPGVTLARLLTRPEEDVRLERWAPDCTIDLPAPGGMELLVLAGQFEESGEIFAQHDWLRLPAGAQLAARAGDQGCRLWVKSGHLARPPRAPAQPT